jgi:hypothetical protein
MPSSCESTRATSKRGKTSRVGSKLHCGSANKKHPYEVIKLDNGVFFYACRRMVDMGLAEVEQEIREGLLQSNVHPMTVTMNCQAWTLMQSPVAGEG